MKPGASFCAAVLVVLVAGALGQVDCPTKAFSQTDWSVTEAARDDTSGPTFCGSCSCAITISLGLSLEDVGFRINGQSVVSLINSDPVVWGVFVGKCQSSYISAWVDSGVGSIQVAEKLARQCKKSADQLLACKEQVDASPEFKQLLESGDAGP